MLHTIFVIVTAIVTFILGIIVKKMPNINNKLIPIQNLIIDLITKDFSMVLAGVGLFTGGTYDIVNNLQKLIPELKK